MLPYLTALFVLFWQWNNQRRCRPVFWGRRLKKVVNFFEEKSASGDLGWGLSDLEMTWLLYCAGVLITCLTTLLVIWKWPGCLDVLALPLQTRPSNLGYESVCRLLSSTLTIFAYCYYSVQKLVMCCLLRSSPISSRCANSHVRHITRCKTYIWK